MKVACLVLALACAAQASSVQVDDQWERFKKTFGKAYKDDTEDGLRRQIFMDNLQKIASINKKQSSFHVEMNEFGDLAEEEFAATRLGTPRPLPIHRNGGKFLFPQNEDPHALPKTVDWREHGFVTPVKNQGRCGSCWAFSTTGSVEGQHFRATGKLISLSEQNLVDCSAPENDHGCQGGLTDQAFSYIAVNGGIEKESDYPYQGAQGKCQFDPSKVAATVASYVDIQQQNETQLMEAVATIGPISVGIDAKGDGFMYYKRGIFYADNCSPRLLDHGVLVVGYGTENGQDYWLVKNSWGPNWGLNGYVKMARNRWNNCGIATAASYPVV